MLSIRFTPREDGVMRPVTRAEEKDRRRLEFLSEFKRLWARLPAGVKNTEVARHIGIHPSSITKYLDARTDTAPARSTLIGLGRYLREDVRIYKGGDQFETIQCREIDLSPEERQLVEKLRAAARHPRRGRALTEMLTHLLHEMAEVPSRDPYPANPWNDSASPGAPPRAKTKEGQAAWNAYHALKGTAEQSDQQPGPSDGGPEQTPSGPGALGPKKAKK